MTTSTPFSTSGKKRQKFHNANDKISFGMDSIYNDFRQNLTTTGSFSKSNTSCFLQSNPSSANNSRKTCAPRSSIRADMLMVDPTCRFVTSILRYGTAKQKYFKSNQEDSPGKENSRCNGQDSLSEMNRISSSEFLVYEVEVCIFRNGKMLEKWVVFRRYSAFKHLCTALSRMGNDVRLPHGARSGSNDKSHSFYSKRGILLDAWLKEICLQSSENLLNDLENDISLFLTPDEELRSSTSFIESPYDCGSGRVERGSGSPVKFGKFYSIDSLALEGSQKSTENVNLNTPFRKKKVSAATPMSISKSVEKPKRKANKYPPLDSYNMVRVIGKGSFGMVLVARFSSQQTNSLNNHQPVAVKILKISEMINRNQAIRVDIERQCLERANSPFIVGLHGVYRTKSHLYFVQDYCAAGELYFHLERHGFFSNKLSRFYAAECILAIEHLHNLGIVYRDLKPENIMLDATGHIKLVDFGLAKVGVHDSSSGAKSFVGTTEYLSPEMILKKGHGLATDWWALGMVLYEMLAGLPPWYSEDKQEVLQGILHSPLKFTSKISTPARSLLAALLERIPQNRLGSNLGAAEIKEDPYFASINWGYLASKRIKPPFIPKLNDTFDTSFFDESFTSLSTKLNEDLTFEERKMIQKADNDNLFSGFQTC